MQLAFALVAVVAASVSQGADAPLAATRAPALAMLPFSGSGELGEGTLPYLQRHVVYWVRRWGQPVDDAEATQLRIGPDEMRRLGTCVMQAADCPAAVPYTAVLSGSISVEAGEWKIMVVVTGIDGERWTAVSASARSLTGLMDALIPRTQQVADTVARHVGRPMFEPPTRPYATAAFVTGGAAVAAGIVFFILSATEDGKLSNPRLPLSDAVSARNAANTYAIVGYTLTAVGVASVAAGVLLYAPGARPPPAPGLTLSVDLARGMVLLGGKLP